jgi:hypothetical protein
MNPWPRKRSDEGSVTGANAGFISSRERNRVSYEMKCLERGHYRKQRSPEMIQHFLFTKSEAVTSSPT